MKAPYLRVWIFEPVRRWYGLKRSRILVECVVADDGDCLFTQELASGWCPPKPPGDPWVLKGRL